MSSNIDQLARFADSPAYEQAREVIQRLFYSRFIHRDHDKQAREDYDFIYRNKDHISTILSLSGFRLNISDAEGRRVAYIESECPVNRQHFSKDESVVILRLLYIYKEQTRTVSLSNEIVITAQELLEQVNMVRRSNAQKMRLDDLKQILFMLSRNQLVRVNGKKKDFSGDTTISILSSLSCLLPSLSLQALTDKLKAYAMEGSRQTAEEKESEDGSDE